MRTTFVVGILVAAGCAAPAVEHRDDRGWAERMADADRHDHAAAAHEQEAARAEVARVPGRYVCGDTVLQDQATTGGLRITQWQPCFDLGEESVEHQHFLAARERQAARADRRAAESLVEAEVAACGTIPAREREHSPFAHRKEIARVVPHYDSGLLRGVWVVFKPVAGLTADWLRADLACHRAQWAVLGKHPTAAPDDPTLVDGAKVTVFDRGDHVEVLVTTDTLAAAEVALARAEGALAQGAREATR